jgi:hypothetical protein
MARPPLRHPVTTRLSATELAFVVCRITFRFQTHNISRFFPLWDIKTGTFRRISFPCMTLHRFLPIRAA